MRARLRLVLFGVGAAGLATLLLWGFAGLPRFGAHVSPYGEAVNQRVAPERRAASAVAAVTFDYRGTDTLGEEWILFGAVIGVAVLLRAARDEEEGEAGRDEAAGRPPAGTSEAERVVALLLVGPTVLVGLYLVAHGHLSPGGGFQGGVVLGTAPLMIYLAGEYSNFTRVAPERLLDTAEAVGAGGFVAIGLWGLVAGPAFLANRLPLGRFGQLTSAGTTPLLNAVVGLAVSAGIVLLLTEFLQQTLAVRRTLRR